MVLVRATEAFTGLEIKAETTWGVDPGTWGTGSYRVPFRSENLHYEDAILPLSSEFSGLGGLLGLDRGARIVRGSLTVEPVYSEIWFWLLFGQCFGSEDLVVDNDVLATGSLTTLNTHIFNLGTGIPTGLAMRAFRAGEGPVASGYVDTITGLVVEKWRWEQPEGDRATLTIDFIGKAITTVAGTGLTLATLETTLAKLKAPDLQRAGSLWLLGATLTAHKCTSFSIEVDRKIEPPPAFLQSLLTLDKPGATAIREVKMSFESNLEQDYNANFKPWKEFIAQQATQFVCVYDSGVVAAAATNYKIRFDIPRLEYTAVTNNAEEALLKLTGEGTAVVAALSTLSSGYNDYVTVPASGSTELRCLVNVVQTDEATTDTKFTALPNG